MRIAWFVHGRGKGHAIRARAALPRLEGRDVHVFGGGEARVLLGDVPGFTPITPSLPGPSVLRVFPRRVREDLDRLRALRPDLLVSDGDGPSVHAARLLGVPAIAMSHGLVFGHAHLPKGLPRVAILRERLNAASASWPVQRRIAVHFAPLVARTPGTIVARPDLREDLVRKPSDGALVAYFRDGGGEGWLSRLAARGHRVRLFGSLTRAIPGVEIEAPSIAGFAAALERAAGVVATAGNHLPAECAMLGVPILALHARADAEQAMNARLVEHARLGVAGVLDAPDDAAIVRYEDALRSGAAGPDRTRVRAMPTVSEALASSLDAALAARPR